MLEDVEHQMYEHLGQDHDGRRGEGLVKIYAALELSRDQTCSPEPPSLLQSVFPSDDGFRGNCVAIALSHFFLTGFLHGRHFEHSFNFILLRLLVQHLQMFF